MKSLEDKSPECGGLDNCLQCQTMQKGMEDKSLRENDSLELRRRLIEILYAEEFYLNKSEKLQALEALFEAELARAEKAARIDELKRCKLNNMIAGNLMHRVDRRLEVLEAKRRSLE